jgi:hypothetical protein
MKLNNVGVRIDQSGNVAAGYLYFYDYANGNSLQVQITEEQRSTLDMLFATWKVQSLDTAAAIAESKANVLSLEPSLRGNADMSL